MTISRALVTVLAFILASVGTPGSAQPSQPGPQRWEADIRAFEEADRKAPAPEGAVLFVGSSSIRMWDTLQRDFPDVRLVQRGFGGSTLADVVFYADRIILPYRPRMVVVYAGDNDLAAGKTPETVFADYKALVRKIRRALPRTRIAFIAIKPSLARWKLIASIRKANALIEEHASRHRRLRYVDVFTPMLDRDGTPRKELFVEDGLHLNARGYALWKDVLAPTLR
jgi:lysophospholipase L1-like esterase